MASKETLSRARASTWWCLVEAERVADEARGVGAEEIAREYERKASRLRERLSDLSRMPTETITTTSTETRTTTDELAGGEPFAALVRLAAALAVDNMNDQSRI
jgi:hypothetical protein